MRISAITRYKHGDLFVLLKKLHWTQVELGRRCGLRPGQIGDIINLQRRPTLAQAEKIQTAFGEAGEYVDVLGLWPEAFRLEQGFQSIDTQDVSVELLPVGKEALQIEYNPNPDEETHEKIYGMERAMEELDGRERSVLRERFINGKTFKQIGDQWYVTRARVEQIKNKALRRLRHPRLLNMIENPGEVEKVP